MGPGEIIKACMERGLLVSGEDLKRIEAGMSIDELLASKQTQPNEVPKGEEKPAKITCRLRRARPKGMITPNEILEQHKSKYDTIKGMLLSKTSAVSVGNVRDSAASVSIIGMVKRVAEGGFTLEDVTGEMDVVCESKGIDDGDVICARGPVKNGRMSCRNVLYPDVPLLRPIGRIEASMLLIPAAGKPAASADIVISTEPTETESKNIVLDSNPSHLSIHKDGKVNVLFYKTEGEVSQQDAINMLKKRLLKKPHGMLADGGAFLIEPVPDIFWIVGKGQDWIETYKGVTIVHSAEKQAFIDLKTREAKLI